VNRETEPSASGSTSWILTIVGGGVRILRADVSRWKSRTASSGASTTNA